MSQIFQVIGLSFFSIFEVSSDDQRDKRINGSNDQPGVGRRGHERERNKATTLGRVCEGPCLERLQGIWHFAVDGIVEVCRSYVICSVFTDFTVCFRVPLHLTFSSTMPQLHIMKS